MFSVFPPPIKKPLSESCFKQQPDYPPLCPPENIQIYSWDPKTYEESFSNVKNCLISVKTPLKPLGLIILIRPRSYLFF